MAYERNDKKKQKQKPPVNGKQFETLNGMDTMWTMEPEYS